MKPFSRIVHLSTGHAGGAGLAARRLNETLNANGVSSRFFALKQKDFILKENEAYLDRTLSQKISGALNTRIQNRINNRVVVSLSSSNGMNLSNLFSKIDKKNSIIQIHNWFNLLSFRDIKTLATSGFNIVFTMHDQRIFTGGCHYAFNCRGFESDCSNCPSVQRYKQSKVLGNNLLFQEILKENHRIRFTAPSRWLVNEANNSKILGTHEILYAANVLGPTFLNNVNISEPATKGAKRPKIGVASGDPYSLTKGGDVVRLIQNSKKTDLVFMADYNESELARFWNDIDVLFVPSRADNSPNVIIEANAFGIPIVASNVGGIPENLQLEYDKLFDVDNVVLDSLINLFADASNNKDRKILDTPKIQELREVEAIESYKSIYSELLGK